jgi:hypothetical protein
MGSCVSCKFEKLEILDRNRYDKDSQYKATVDEKINQHGITFVERQCSTHYDSGRTQVGYISGIYKAEI